MSLNDPLANTLSHILTQDKKGKRKIIVNHNSKVIRAVLTLLKDNNYLGSFTVVDDGKAGVLEINLLGAINKIGVIKPRYSIKLSDFVKFEKRFLPAYGFGFLIVSTSQGIMTQEQAEKKKIGGKLIAYVY